MFELEKRGVPTVGWTAQRFVADAISSGRAFGLNNVALAVIPVPGTSKEADTVRRMATESFDQVIAGLTKPLLANAGEVAATPSETLKIRGEDLLDASARMNGYFLEQAWSDGLPLVPPTAEAVERMLSGTHLDRLTVIGFLEPGFGIATVEKIAINAVMAGCYPEHMPVVITAVQVLADPQMMLRNVAMSTGPHAPLVLVNGPIAKKLKINAKSCALGPGSISHANVVIGRAIRLIMMNVGHCYPGTGDMDTLGSPTKFSMCLGENEEDTPWTPFHVDRGYDRDTSTVTIHWNYGLCDVLDTWSLTPLGLVEKFASSTMNLGHIVTGHWLQGHRADPRYGVEEKDHNLILMGPDHAKVFARNNWGKEQVREALFQQARMPFKQLVREMCLFETAHPELMHLKEQADSLMPVLETPDCWDIVVAGADVGRSIFTWGAGEPLTKPIEGE